MTLPSLGFSAWWSLVPARGWPTAEGDEQRGLRLGGSWKVCTQSVVFYKKRSTNSMLILHVMLNVVFRYMFECYLNCLYILHVCVIVASAWICVWTESLSLFKFALDIYIYIYMYVYHSMRSSFISSDIAQQKAGGVTIFDHYMKE